MFKRRSSSGSLSLRDLADDFFSQPPNTKTKMDSSSLGRSSYHLNKRRSTGNLPGHCTTFEVPLAPPSSRGKSSGKSATADDFLLSLNSFSAFLRNSAMDAEMRLSQNQKEYENSSNDFDFFDELSPSDVRYNDIEALYKPSKSRLSRRKNQDNHGKSDKSPKSSKSSLKPKTSRRSSSPADVSSTRNGFFDMPSPPFLTSPDDVRSNVNIGAIGRPTPKISLPFTKNQDEHGKSDKPPRSSKSSHKPKSSRRKSSPADTSHSHRAHEKKRSSRRNSLQQPQDDKEPNPSIANERQSSVRRVSSFSVENTNNLNQKGLERPSSSTEDKNTETISKEAAVLHSNTSEDTKKSYPSTSYVKKYLHHYADALRLPDGFITSIIKAYKSTDSRLWLMENTSSMKIRDSHRAKIDAKLTHIQKDGGHSRWTELSQTVDFHMKMSARCFVPTKFWLVNDPGSSVGPQRFSIARGNYDDVKTERTIALDMMERIRLDTDQNHLSRQLRKIEKRVIEEAPRLIAANKVVTVVLCTQGRQTDEHGNEGSAVMKDCADSLKALSKLPVKIVVRLCAHDERAEELVSKIDGKLDSVVILGDFWEEAMKVHLHNPWLTYGLGIHRLREACLTSDLLHDLGRRAFTADDIHEFCKEFLIGEKEIYLPHPHNSLDAFLRVINYLLEDEKSQWNPVKKKLTPWIDIKELERQCRSRL